MATCARQISCDRPTVRKSHQRCGLSSPSTSICASFSRSRRRWRSMESYSQLTRMRRRTCCRSWLKFSTHQRQRSSPSLMAKNIDMLHSVSSVITAGRFDSMVGSSLADGDRNLHDGLAKFSNTHCNDCLACSRINAQSSYSSTLAECKVMVRWFSSNW